jgi:ketosteroid isomerase-like protein
MQSDMLSQVNESLIQEYLDLVANDSENLERTMRLIADDCVWIMQPTGDVYNGKEEIKALLDIAMSGRTHKGQYSIQIYNWFATNEYLCIEYTHGAVMTGVYSAGLAKIKRGTLRYCMPYHMRDGKFDQVHEYIQGTTFLTNLAMPIALRGIKRLATKQLFKAKQQITAA